MSIKTTLGQLKNANDARALAKVSDLIPPGSYKFRVAKLIDAVEADLKGLHKQHVDLLKKYGVPGKDASGQAMLTVVGAAPENIEAFNDAFGKLLETETLVPYEPILWSKLGTDAQEKLTVGDVRALGPLLVEDDAAPAPGAPVAPVLASVPPAK